MKLDFRGKRLISILGFKLAKRKIDSKLLEAWKREKEGEENTENTRHWFVVPQAGVAWKNERIGWSGVGVGVGTKWRNEKPKTKVNKGGENRVNGKHVFVIMNVDIFIQLKRATFRINF